MIFKTRHPTPVGTVTLAGDGDNLLGLWLEGQKYFGGTVDEAMTERADARPFHLIKDWLDRYFAGRRPDPAGLPLAPRGGEFRRAVWDVLREIPYGAVVTYGEVAGRAAARLGRSGGCARAAGGAVGRNPISIIIPCHRVVGAGGRLTGYAGGLANKRLLLELEGAVV